MLIGCRAIQWRCQSPALPSLFFSRALALTESAPQKHQPVKPASKPGKIVHRVSLKDLLSRYMLDLRTKVNWRRHPYLKTAKSLYCICAEYPDHSSEWVGGAGRLGLDDSFLTWHAITSLHLWLVMQRLRGIGEARCLASSGAAIDYQTRYIVYGMGRLFYKDIGQRLQDFSSYMRKNHAAKHMFNHFQSANLNYKLAYQENDLALAELLWRQVCLCSPRVDAQSLNLLVRYVRANYRHLQSVSEADLLGNGVATFLPLEPRATREATKAWMRDRLKYALVPHVKIVKTDSKG